MYVIYILQISMSDNSISLFDCRKLQKSNQKNDISVYKKVLSNQVTDALFIRMSSIKYLLPLEFGTLATCGLNGIATVWNCNNYTELVEMTSKHLKNVNIKLSFIIINRGL